METYYNEETHEYFVDGTKVPSVTEICSPISFQRLDALSKSILDKARERGHKCHEYFEEYMLLHELDTESVEDEYFPYIKQFIEWYITYKPKTIYTEKQLFGEDYSGTCDLICEIDGKTLLVDYKTTSAIDKKSLSVQLEGYYRLCEKHNIKIDECWFLHIKKDGWVFKPIKRNPRWFDILLEHNTFMKEKYDDLPN